MHMMPNCRCIFDSYIRPFRELLFPPLCFICEKLLGPNEEIVCAACLSGIRPVGKTDQHYQETLSRLAGEGAVSGLIAGCYFEEGGPLQSIVHQLKYSGMTSLGVLLGRRLGERVKDELAGEEIRGIVPVPLHFSKKRERGYNQSEFICKGMATVLGVPVEARLVMRRVYTQSQTTLSRDERALNVAGAFALRRHAERKIRDATVLLVDDVLTTGSTMRECAGVLVDAGAGKVIACALALAT